MINKFPILKDNLNTLFQEFSSKSQSLIQLGKAKYLKPTERKKEMNSRPSNYNSDEDISLTSTQSKNSRRSTKSIRSDNKIKTRLNYDIKNQPPQRQCRNDVNCRFRPNCLFFHSADLTPRPTNPINNKKRRNPNNNPPHNRNINNKRNNRSIIPHLQILILQISIIIFKQFDVQSHTNIIDPLAISFRE